MKYELRKIADSLYRSPSKPIKQLEGPSHPYIEQMKKIKRIDDQRELLDTQKENITEIRNLLSKKRYDDPYEKGDRVLWIPKDLPCEIMKLLRTRAVCKDRFNKDHIVNLNELRYI